MNSPLYTNHNGPARLTQEDVRKLLNESAAESRVEVAQKIALQHRQGAFQQNELLVAEQIFRLLLRDTEVRVRAALAEGLKDDNEAPRDVILALAADKAEVASSVLQHSDVLNDDDLLEIVRGNQEITRHIAIANRKTVSDTVSAALVETENPDVVSHLVKNAGADISEHSLRRIISDHGDRPGVISIMVQRSSLPVTVVENLLNLVSDTVAQGLKQKYRDVADKLERQTQKTRESMTLKLLDTTLDPNEVQMLVGQLHDSKRLTPSIILTALCRGNSAFFEISLAKMAGIPLHNARKLINDKGSLGFKSLYKKAGLPESMFEPCRLVLDVLHEMHADGSGVHPGTIHYANRMVEKIFIKTSGREVDNLAYIIALIRQNMR